VISIPNSQYTQVKVSVPSQIAADFKTACLTYGVSMASVLSQYMAKFSSASCKSGEPTVLSTKRQRRAAIAKVILHLQQVLNAEQSYRERIPDNLQSSSVADNADQWVDGLEDVIESLGSLP
jgi:hypothetical protein